MNDTVARYRGILSRIRAAEAGAGRRSGCVELVAVTKTFDAEEIAPLIAAGHRVFGENRVQEAMAKWPALRELNSDLELHLIGPLQSNKTGEAVALFDVIETLDREKIAAAIARESQRQGRQPRLLAQVNTGAETQKSGLAPKAAQAFVARCASEYGLAIDGLMCIPPMGESPRAHFDLLRQLAAETGLVGLSMGMSADFETAIACGATSVRVGSALFGAR